MNKDTKEPKNGLAVDTEHRIHLEWAHRHGVTAWARSMLGNSAMLEDMGVDAGSLDKLRALTGE